MRYAPAPGLKVRDPQTRVLIPAEGVEVGPHDFDLHRLIQWGDLVDVKATAAPVAAPAVPAAPAPAPGGAS